MTHGKKNNLTAKEKRIKKCPRHQRNFAVSLFLFAREVFFCRDSGGPPYKGEENNKQLDSEDAQLSRTLVVNI